MKEEHKSAKEMWGKYLAFIDSNITNTEEKYSSWHFCDNEKDANNLAELTKQRIKRATTGLYYWHEVEGEKLPEAGDISIITDWYGVAQCIIQVKKVSIVPFKEVTEEFAKIEGEGDKSLEYWRTVHIDFFSRELKDYGKEFSEDMLVVCEEFEVVYK